GLLANDSFEGAETITAVTQGAHGTVTIIDAAAGLISYTPAAGYYGLDSYTYTVTSGGITETATVSVAVGAVDSPATFSGATTGTGTEDGGALTGTLNVSDADGIANPAFFVTAQPAHGTAGIHPVTGAWTYTPAADYNGPDSFTVRVTDDDGNFATQVISLTVTAVADVVNDSETVAEDGSVTTAVRGNDTFEGATPTLTGVTQGAHGTVSIVNAALGTVLYTPDPNFHGIDTYTYTVSSGGVTETATVTVTVTPVNDPATFGGNTTGSGTEDGAAITGTLTAADAADGMAVPNFEVSGLAGHGVAWINATTGAWTYTPDPDYNGADSFTVRVTDNLGNTATQVITVAVAAAPDILADSITVTEDVSLVTDVVDNDDFEGTPLVTAVTQGAHGTVTIENAALGTVRYTPDANYHGPDSYTYTVTSGGVTETVTVGVTVVAVDDPASFSGATSGTGAEDNGPITGTLNVTDAADNMTAPGFVVSGNPLHGTAFIHPVTGAWTYTPAADYQGPDSFTVTVTDGDNNTATQVISLTVTAVADITADAVSTTEDGGVTSNL
ncbi:MAG TPA: Ig-like domain-containing protein, partial [Ramlibacter sp.]